MDCKEALLGKYFPHQWREVKVEELINLKRSSMSVHKYLVKFIMFSRYVPSLVSKPRDEMSRFVTSVADFLNEEWRIAILCCEMNLSRLIVYGQSIMESKHTKISKIY